MLVCHCAVKTEDAVRECIADGARDEDDLGQRCGAGVTCGGCVPRLIELLEEMEQGRLPVPTSAA